MRRVRWLVAALAAALLSSARLAAAPVATPSATPSEHHRLSLDLRDADLVDVLRLLATESGVNVIADASVKHDRVTLRLHDVTFDTALSVIAHAYDLQVRREGGVRIVGMSGAMNRKYGDAAGELGARTAVLPTRRAQPEELVKPLTDALPPGTVVIADKHSGALLVTGDPASVQRARRLVAALDAPVRGGVAAAGTVSAAAIPLRYARAAEAIKQLKGVIPDNGYVADERQNAVLITGSAETIATARQLLAALDVASPQVMFEVRVAAVTRANDTSNIGVLFGGVGAPPGQAVSTFANRSIAINATLNALI
jgi:type II secretory pathway component GspD/PulD (secretin)